MKKPKLIYLIALGLVAYGVWTVRTWLYGGPALPGIIGLIPLAGAVGLFLQKSWSRYLVDLFAIAVVPVWIFYTVWYVWKNGWPYYATTTESILGLLPGGFISLFCIGSSWIVHKHFRSRTAERA